MEQPSHSLVKKSIFNNMFKDPPVSCIPSTYKVNKDATWVIEPSHTKYYYRNKQKTCDLNEINTNPRGVTLAPTKFKTLEELKQEQQEQEQEQQQEQQQKKQKQVHHTSLLERMKLQLYKKQALQATPKTTEIASLPPKQQIDNNTVQQQQQQEKEKEEKEDIFAKVPVSKPVNVIATPDFQLETEQKIKQLAKEQTFNINPAQIISTQNYMTNSLSSSSSSSSSSLSLSSSTPTLTSSSSQPSIDMDFTKYTWPDLKKICQQNNIKVNNKSRHDLIELLQVYYKKQQEANCVIP